MMKFRKRVCVPKFWSLGDGEGPGYEPAHPGPASESAGPKVCRLRRAPRMRKDSAQEAYQGPVSLLKASLPALHVLRLFRVEVLW